MAPSISPALRGQGGPAWLESRRRQALEVLTTQDAPSASEEIWRYAPIGDRDILIAERSGQTPEASEFSPAATVVIRGGAITVVSAPEGVTIAPFSTSESAPELADPSDFLVALNQATLNDGVHLRVNRGSLIAEPMVIVHELGAGFSSSRIIIDLAEGSSCELIEIFTGGDASTLNVPVTEAALAPGSSLRYASVQVLSQDAWHLASLQSYVDQDANLTQFIAGIGAAYDRCRNDVSLVGEGASSTLHATYHGEHRQVHDLRVNQDHQAPRTLSNMLCKGAVRDESHSIYSGMIRMRNGAVRSDAVQTNHNLVLDESARADSVPNLEIEENDVRCAHGSTVGPLDEDQRFYLEARGIDPDHVETLLVQGFYEDLLASVSPRAADLVRPALTKRLAKEVTHG